jgi:hypothetical protein
MTSINVYHRALQHLGLVYSSSTRYLCWMSYLRLAILRLAILRLVILNLAISNQLPEFDVSVLMKTCL